MNRAKILAEIKRLEAQKAENPAMAVEFNAQITALCDKLKQSNAWTPRKVV